MRAVLVATAQVPAISPTRVGIDETVMATGKLTTRRREPLTALVFLDLPGRRGRARPKSRVCGRVAGRTRPGREGGGPSDLS